MKLYISLTLFTILLNFCKCRIRLNAKEIERNFDGIHQEIVEIKKNLQYYHKRINKLDGKSRNDTVIYHKLVQRLNHLQYELERIKEVQQRELKEKLGWKTQAENNSRLIYDFKMALQNKMNENQNLMTKRIERLEQQYLYGQRSILNLEEKIARETTKNRQLSNEVQMFKSSIRQVYNNMTDSINKLRRKHDWIASRIYNKSVENTEMMRHFQRYAEELQKQIFALQKRASTEEKEAPFRLKDMLMSLLYESEKEQKITTTIKTKPTTVSSTTSSTTATTSTTTTTPKTTTSSTTTTLKPTTLSTTTTTTTTTTTKVPTSTTSTTTTTATTPTPPPSTTLTNTRNAATRLSTTTQTPLNTHITQKATTLNDGNTTQEVSPTGKPSTTTVEQQQQQQTTTEQMDNYDISTTKQIKCVTCIPTTISTPSEVGQDTESIDIDQPLANGVFLDQLPDRFDGENEQQQGETFTWDNDDN